MESLHPDVFKEREAGKKSILKKRQKRGEKK